MDASCYIPLQLKYLRTIKKDEVLFEIEVDSKLRKNILQRANYCKTGTNFFSIILISLIRGCYFGILINKITIFVKVWLARISLSTRVNKSHQRTQQKTKPTEVVVADCNPVAPDLSAAPTTSVVTYKALVVISLFHTLFHFFKESYKVLRNLFLNPFILFYLY